VFENASTAEDKTCEIYRGQVRIYNESNFLIGAPEGKRQLEKPWHRRDHISWICNKYDVNVWTGFN